MHRTNTILIIIVIVLLAIAGYVAYTKNITLEDAVSVVQTNQGNQEHEDPNVSDGQPPAGGNQQRIYSDSNVSFTYTSNAPVFAQQSQYGQFYNIYGAERPDYPDSLQFYPNGIPANYVMSTQTTVINGKTFRYADSTGEPVRLYFYEKNGKAVIVNIQLISPNQASLIDLGSIEIK